MIRDFKETDELVLKSIYEEFFGVNFNKQTEIIKVYILNDEVVGFISYELLYERAELNYIYVIDKYRHNGIASKLLKYMINDTIIKKISSITLEVNVNNEAAISLYEKFGFSKVTERKNYYQNGDNAFLMYMEVAMNDVFILGIESSCDETSVSIVKNGCEDIATVVLSQMDTHANYGGVVPEIASRMHVEAISAVIEDCLNKASMKMEDITAIAVTAGPGLIGSLLVGTTAALTLAYLYDKPLVPVHHISGHIYANNIENEMRFPLISLVVSGGHTELIYMKDHYHFEKIGGTVDDAVGEAYDKVARVIKVPYPCGPLVDKLAGEGEDTYPLPLPLDDDSYNFSFSGLKSAVINLVHNEEQRGNKIDAKNLATSFQNRVKEIITKKTLKALKEYDVKNLIVAGGVAANSGLRKSLAKMAESNDINLSIPSLKYCTDNATMIAASGYFAYMKGIRSGLDLKTSANLNLY